jgi:HEAT repeat protein
MRDGQRGAERAPLAIERFVKQLLVVHKAAKLYPPASEIPLESASDLLAMLREVLREQPELRFQVTKEALLHNALPVLPESRPFQSFAREFYHRNLAEVRFHAGVTPKEVITFLRVLQEPVNEINAAGGFEQRLWDQQVDGVTVRLVSTKIVETDLHGESALPTPDEEWPPSRLRIDELIDAAYGARPRDQRMLVRFAQNPRLVSRYLNELVSEGRGGRPLTNLIAGRVVSLAHAAWTEISDEQPEIFRSIAESLLSLDPEVRRSVLVERLLPESRIDEAVAAVMRQFELGELCKALVEGVGSDAVSRDGLSRAIRNLAVISLQPKEEVLSAAEGAMREAGMDEASIGSVLEGAAPSQLRMPTATDNKPDSVENLLRLVDLAPVAAEAFDEEADALRAEVSDGITDGDVIVGIITLVTIERRPDMFASLMSLIEDGLGLLLEWGEYVDAAEAAGALRSLDADPTLERAQRERVVAALAALARPKFMNDVASGVRVHEPGSIEHDSCKRLILALGGLAISPLLEVLANEPDMAARKALVDMLSEMAPQHITELGEHTGDSRWYFVRNIVIILASTRNAAVLPHLNRTLRHPDARVRRETIRAVASIRDRLALAMLIAALSDDDAQNVALAARYLGNLRATEAISALIAVARGEGIGNRDHGPRVEAIEALGLLATKDAEAALLNLTRQRAILRGGRSREIAAAADAALESVARSRRGEGADA